jgi:predicted nucleic acid-binding protein
VTFLADKSALARLADPRVAPILGPLIARGLVAMCAVVQLEVGHSARSADELERLLADHAAIYPWVEVPAHAWRRAQEVQVALAARGQHRGVGIPDLLIAATAEAARLTVLHYDHDFDLIAAVTGQPVRWVADPAP